MADRDPSRYRPGVGVMVLDRHGLVWIGRRAGAPSEAEGPGTWWQMPQGGIDAGEDPARAALRELAEETGMRSVAIVAEAPDWVTYDLPEELQGKAWGGRYRGQRQKWFAARFLGAEDEIDITAAGGHGVEFEAWRWVHAAELVDLVVPFKRDAYAAVVRVFSPLARPVPDTPEPVSD